MFLASALPVDLCRDPHVDLSPFLSSLNSNLVFLERAREQGQAHKDGRTERGRVTEWRVANLNLQARASHSHRLLKAHAFSVDLRGAVLSVKHIFQEAGTERSGLVTQTATCRRKSQ